MKKILPLVPLLLFVFLLIINKFIENQIIKIYSLIGVLLIDSVIFYRLYNDKIMSKRSFNIFLFFLFLTLIITGYYIFNYL